MTYKNQGPDVSENPTAVAAGGGQYTADEHSFESMVFQQDRPVLDWELNLLQEILGQAGSRLLSLRTLPSCFLTGDFLERPDPGGSYVFLPAADGNQSQFKMLAANLSVNGWPVRFEYSGSATPGENVIQLPAPPGGGNRLDLVILEVWRALVSPAPDSTNKSPTGQLLRNGNAKAGDSFPPGNVNLADDLVDPTYTQGTQRRIQIQYRYRVISGATIDSSNIDGLGTVLARSVPYQAGSTVDGEAPLSPLAYLSASFKSFGLWMAGSGNAASATALGTVDGFMYAVPLCAVHRRNSAAFDEVTNRNGAPLTGASNVRPDGLFADQIVAGDVIDLRHGVAMDLSEVLDKNFQYLLDNTLCTGTELFTDGLSTVGGSAFTVGDNIGASSQSMGKPDGVRAHFSDRRTVEPAVHVAAGLSSVTSISVDLSSVNLPWAPGTNVLLNCPSGTVLLGVGKVRLVVSGTSDTDILSSAPEPKVLSVVITSVAANITFDSPITGDLYVELLVQYPGSTGAQRNILEPIALWTPAPTVIAAWAEPLLFDNTGLPAGRYTLPEGPGSPDSGKYWNADPGHRELSLFIPAQATSGTFIVDVNGKIFLPERVSVANSGTGGVTVASFTYDGGYTVLTLSPSQSAGTSVVINYAPFRPPPPTSDHYTIWYKSRAVQAVSPPSGTQTLKLIPRCFSKSLHIITSGSGSPDDGFPYAEAGAQIPIPTQPPTGHSEASQDSPNVISLLGFGMNSGYAQVPVLLPYSPNPSQVQLYKSAPDGVLDGDDRPFWPRSDDGSVPLYSPTVYGQPLTLASRHKVAYPVICELKEDFNSIGVRGTLVMVVFCNWVSLNAADATVVGVSMSSNPGDSGAAVYKLKGGFLSARRTDQ